MVLTGGKYRRIEDRTLGFHSGRNEQLLVLTCTIHIGIQGPHPQGSHLREAREARPLVFESMYLTAA